MLCSSSMSICFAGTTVSTFSNLIIFLKSINFFLKSFLNQFFFFMVFINILKLLFHSGFKNICLYIHIFILLDLCLYFILYMKIFLSNAFKFILHLPFFYFIISLFLYKFIVNFMNLMVEIPWLLFQFAKFYNKFFSLFIFLI